MNYTTKINTLSNEQVFIVDKYKNMKPIIKHITSEQLYQTITESVVRSINEDIEGTGTTSTITAQEVIRALQDKPHEMVDYNDTHYTIGVDLGDKGYDTMVYIEVDYEADFHITPYRAATYLQPEEGGDAEFDRFRITGIEVLDADEHKLSLTPEEQEAIAKEVAEDMTEDRLRSAYETQIENYDDGDWDRYDDD